MHSSTHTRALSDCAAPLGDHHKNLKDLVANVIRALAPIDTSYREIHDSLTLAHMDESDDLARSQLDRLPPFVAGVQAELVTVKSSLVRLAAIAGELDDAMGRLQAMAEQPASGRRFHDREEIAIRRGPAATPDEIALAFGMSLDDLRAKLASVP